MFVIPILLQYLPCGPAQLLQANSSNSTRIQSKVFLPRKEQPQHRMTCLCVGLAIKGLDEQVLGGHFRVALHHQVLGFPDY